MRILTKPFQLLGYAAYITALIFLLDTAVTIDMSLIYGLLSLLLLTAAFLVISIPNKLIILLLTGSASFIFIQEGTGPREAAEAFGTNANILALFLLIPLAGTYMSYTGYLTSLKQFIVKRSTVSGSHPYRLSFLLTLSIGFVLNYGSLAIIRQIADESFRSFREKQLTLHMMRAFACCMLWSPYFVNVGLITALFDVSWFSIGLFGMIMALIYALTAAFWLRFTSFSQEQIVENKPEPMEREASILPLLRFGGIFTGLSFLLYYMFDVSMIVIVCTTAVFLPALYALIKKEANGYYAELIKDSSHAFLRLRNELSIFIAAGFFGTAVSATDAGTVISSRLADWTSGSVLLFTVIIIAVTTMFALIGFHPIVIIIGIGSSLNLEALQISPEYASLLLLASWTTATQVSPFAGQILMSSRLMKVTPLELSKKNMGFTAAAGTLLVLFLYSLHLTGIL